MVMITKERVVVEAQEALVAWAEDSVGCRLSPSRPRRSPRSGKIKANDSLKGTTISVIFLH